MFLAASFLTTSISFLHGATRGECTEHVHTEATETSAAGSRDESVSVASSNTSTDQKDACSEGVQLPATQTCQDGQVRAGCIGSVDFC